MKRWLILLWVLVLLATLGGTAYLVFIFQEQLQAVPDLWSALDIRDWLAIGLGTAFFYLMDYVRQRSLLALLNEPLSLPQGLRVLSLSEFASILTPTAELHVPAAVYLLSKIGIPVSKGTAAVTAKTLYGILWIGLIGLISFYASDSIAVPDSLRGKMVYVTLPVIGIVLFFLLVTLFSRHIRRWTQQRLDQSHGRWKHRFLLWLHNSSGAIATIGHSTAPMHLLAHAATIAYVFAYCFVGYWICGAVGIRMSIWRAVAVFGNSLLIDRLAPVPGSIVVTEAATAYMIASGWSTRAFFAAILLRILCKYLLLPVGALISANILRKEGLKILAPRPGPSADARP